MALMHYDDPTYAINRAMHTPLSYGYGRRGGAPVVELIVPMCCAKCQEKIRENMLELRGVQSVLADLQLQRVVVTGFVDPIKVLKKAKKVKKDSVLYTGVAGYGGSEHHYLSPKLHSRSEYRSEYRPSLYRAPVYQPSTVYRSSFNQFGNQFTSPQSYMNRPSVESSYIDGYSPVITNPYYMKHIDSEYY